MRLSEYLSRDLVIHGLDANDRSSALKAIAAALHQRGHVPSGEAVFQSLLDREEVHTTALGDGVAVPHAVIPTLEEGLLVVVSTREPIPYGPEGEEPVDILFALLSPPGREGRHIKLLARICRLARHPGFLSTLRAAEDAEALYRTILDEDSRHV